MINTIKATVADEFERAVRNRRYFHQNPRLSFCEEDTAAYIRGQLDAAGIPYTRCGKNGIVARIRGAAPGPTIAFRADFDALAIEEPEGLPFVSQNPGVMHACGHDAHAASVLSLALIFQQHPEWIRGEVVFLFQYAEELPPGGAEAMIAAGCLQGVDRIYGLHVTDKLDVGTAGICRGASMAASDSFFVEFLGKGGHGSCPSETQDTVSAAASAVLQINGIISRFISPLRSAVISVCVIKGGQSYNVIPGKVRLEGTVRTYEKETADRISGLLKKTVENAAAQYGTDWNFEFERGYPVLVNHPREEVLAEEAAAALSIPFRWMDPTPIGEDFARYLEKIPGAFFNVGIRNPAIDAVYPLHNRFFKLDEEALKVALSMFLGIYMKETMQL